MGIDRHGANFLHYCHAKRPFGRVATIGRQELAAPDLQVKFGRYCEAALRELYGATLVDSYDCSDYEGATFIADFNQPFKAERRYDTVIDCGTTEHIFDVAQGLRNMSALCSDGGQIIHVSPASNFCGHGFWQFSPEVFLSLYSAQNGYRDTEVFFASLEDHANWFKVIPPQNGKRVGVISRHQLYLMCRTVKSAETIPSVQQSDYIYRWQQDPLQAPTGKLHSFIKEHPALRVAALSLWNVVTRMSQSRYQRLNDRNPQLKKIAVAGIVPPLS